ncbi:hypothetical protein BgiBS90_014828 [Biomphalaria glabrata]|nr:hypothetical protein BgiBS90_014828 [Biomphalaria glabrata]
MLIGSIIQTADMRVGRERRLQVTSSVIEASRALDTEKKSRTTQANHYNDSSPGNLDGRPGYLLIQFGGK